MALKIKSEEICEDQERNNSFVIGHFEDFFSDDLVIADERKMDLVF